VPESIADGREARASISTHLVFYNTVRSHQTLDYWTPGEVFLPSLEVPQLGVPGRIFRVRLF
jgi:hypothetical protein